MPMAGSLLLDTSAILDLFAQVEAVRRLLADAEEVFVPTDRPCYPLTGECR